MAPKYILLAVAPVFWFSFMKHTWTCDRHEQAQSLSSCRGGSVSLPLSTSCFYYSHRARTVGFGKPIAGGKHSALSVLQFAF